MTPLARASRSPPLMWRAPDTVGQGPVDAASLSARMPKRWCAATRADDAHDPALVEFLS